jgi:hypothetical protein
MGKIVEWLEEKSYILMTIFMVLQGILFAIFTIIDLSLKNKSDKRIDIYLSVSMCLFFIFMVHFAHHSVKSFKLDSKSLFYRVDCIFNYVCC